MISPLALILGLALAGGGYFVGERHLAGLATWLVLVVLLALGAAGRATLGRPFFRAAGLIGALALFSALSSFWSGSIELSVTEADRVLVYLGFFLAAFLIAQTDERRQRFAEGIGISLFTVALVALCSRLLPDLLGLGPGPGSNERLGYPLGYWNANALAFGIGCAFALWMSRRSSSAWLRWFGVGMLPALLLALYLTYSRGGVLTLAVACGCLIALSRDRLWLLGTLAIGTIGVLPAILAVQARQSLADNLDTQTTVDQGLAVLLILIAGTVVALGLYALLRRIERGNGAGRALAISRDPGVLKWAAIGLALLAVGAAIAFGGRAWDEFSSSDLQVANQEDRFGQLSGSGRDEFWRVSLDAFGEEPLIGHGAGTYQFSWNQLREAPIAVLDAHSLYLEAFAELGLIGGALVLAMVLALLSIGFTAWHRADGRHRDLHAVLLAACLAFAIGAGIDWFWEIATVGAVFFLASGALVASRCQQLVQQRALVNGRAEERRFGLAVAGLAVAWIAALALIGPLLVDREIDSSNDAAADGNVAAAVEHAENARSIEPWAATPYVQLGLLAESQDDYEGAARRLTQAIEREEGNWQLYYLRARIESRAGDPEAATVDLEEAQRLNPEENCLREGFEGCG